MNLKEFLIAESKNSKITNPKSELARSVMSKIKAVVEKGKTAIVVIDGKVYNVFKDKNTHDIVLEKRK